MARGRNRPWLGWVFGVALLATLVFFVERASEGAAVWAALRHTRLDALALAVLLQLFTYVAQAAAWQVVLLHERAPVALGPLTRLTLAKLFVDQAFPTGGVSGTLLIVKGLDARRVPRPSQMAAVLLNTFTYWLAFVLLVLGALATLNDSVRGSTVLYLGSAAFVLFGLCVMGLVVLLAVGRMPSVLLRLRPVRRFAETMAEASPSALRSGRLLTVITVLQVLIQLLDAATLWALLRALHFEPPVTGVLTSFLLSEAVKAVSIVPGGLGTFDAASTATLALAGVPLAGALAATLLFRVLSLWLPLIPGMFFSQRELRARKDEGPAPTRETGPRSAPPKGGDRDYPTMRTF